MTLAIDIIDGQGLSNEARHELPAYRLSISHSFHQLYITNMTKWSTSVLKVGVLCRYQSL